MLTLLKSPETVSDTGCVIVFVRAPVKGTVKTRLAASLGDAAVLTLYKAFVNDLMKMLEKREHPLHVAFHPPDASAKIEQWLGRAYRLMPQRGNDLGERMANAFRETFSHGFTSAVLIGSDIPDLPGSFIDEAFLSLRNHDAVIGPAIDGGYYLIGFQRETFLSSVFEGISWSTADVLLKTKEILSEKRYQVHILPKLRDIDTIDDLRVLLHESSSKDFADSATMRYIRKRKGELL